MSLQSFIVLPALWFGVASRPALSDDALAASKNVQWTRSHAAHLLRRAGFGGTPEECDHLLHLGRDKAVDLLVDFEQTPQTDPDFPKDTFPPPPPPRIFAGLEESRRKELQQMIRKTGIQDAQEMRDWWLRRMIVTPRPLEEKMTLFWHGHFTSGQREVKSPELLYHQNEFLRKHALADFKTLVKGISRDPAMLVYLDNASNVKAQPNENYARELMELFTLGEGNYTEQDVKEAARAFTGWSVDGRGGKRPRVSLDDEHDGFVFRRNQHDGGQKTFLGRTGNFDGDDIIDIIFEQPATARFLARKLWTFFVESEPDQAIIDALAEKIRQNGFSLRETMRTIFRSDVFYGPHARFALIKSPTELVVSSFRMLGVAPGIMRAANQAMGQMGQELFQPPNVRGWVGGRNWINTSTLFIRYNALGGLVFGSGDGGPKREGMARNLLARLKDDKSSRDAKERSGEQMEMEMSGGAMAGLPEEAQAWLKAIKPPPSFSGPQPVYDPQPVIEKYRLRTPEAIVDHYVDQLLQTTLPKERRAVLVEALAPKGLPFNAASPEGDRRIRNMIHLVMSTPEYQVN